MGSGRLQGEFLTRVGEVLSGALDDELIGVYVHGSVALGGFHPKTSDIDVLAVSRGPISSDQKAQIASGLLQLAVPARGLEFSLVTEATVRHTARAVPFELHVAQEPEIHVVDGTTREGDEDLVLALEICRRSGVPVIGPPSGDLIAPVPSDWLIGFCDRELAWIEDHPGRASWESSVLQACRAWRYLEEGVLSSKLEGGRWALDRANDPELTKAAILRKGGDESLGIDPERALAFVARVRAMLARHRLTG